MFFKAPDDGHGCGRDRDLALNFASLSDAAQP